MGAGVFAALLEQVRGAVADSAGCRYVHHIQVIGVAGGNGVFYDFAVQLDSRHWSDAAADNQSCVTLRIVGMHSSLAPLAVMGYIIAGVAKWINRVSYND